MTTGTLAASPANPRLNPGNKSMERLSLEEAGLGLEVDEFNWDLANKFLAILVRDAKQRPDWSTVMLETLTEKEFEQNTKVVEEKLAKWGGHLGISQPVGAVVGGTGPLREGFEITGEQAQQAVQILKACGRLVQCGRGRGKCLVVMTTQSVPKSVLGTKSLSGATQSVPRSTKATKASKRATRKRPSASATRALRAVEDLTTQGVDGSDRTDAVMNDLRRVLAVVSDLVERYPADRQELEAQLAAARAEADPGRLSQLMADKAVLERRITELESLLAQRESTIKELELRDAERRLTSWS